MPVEVGIRISANNMTGRDFDKLIGDLNRTGQSTEQAQKAADNLRKEFDALGNEIQKTSKVVLDANGRWKDTEGNILSTQQASKRLQNSLSQLSDEQLKQIRIIRDTEGGLQDVRGGYISNAEAARRYAQGIEKTTREFAEADREARRFSNTLQRHRTELRNVALGAGALTVGLGLVGRNFVQGAVQMEGYRNGLIALEGSAAAADERLNSLREIIQLPGVSYEGAIQAAVRLRTVGFEAELANRTITEFGNALALVGSTDLSGALLGFQQIISRGRVSQEELNQLTERSGLFAAALKDAFGSIQSEQIQSQLDAAGQSVNDFAEIFVSQLEKLDRVAADSAANSIQNLQNASFELRASLGDVLLPTATAVIQRITDGINAFNEMDDSVKIAIVSVGVITTGLAALTTILAGTGAALGSINTLLVTTTGASGFAGLSALLAPTGPILIGLGILAAGLAPVVLGLSEVSSATEEARKNSREFAAQLQRTASALEDTSAIDAQITALRQYIREQQAANAERTRQIDDPGLFGSVFLGGTRAAIRERAATTDRIQQSERLLELLNTLNSNRELTIEQLREMDRIIASNLRQARLNEDTEAVKSLEAAAASVVKQFERFDGVVAKTSREAATAVRNFSLELVNLNAALTDAEDGFSNITNITELEAATQRRLNALDAVTRVSREQIEAQIAVEGAALSRLSNQERSESEHAEKIRELAAQLRQLEIDYEQEKTRITREEVDKRTEIYERATQLRIDYAKREAAARLKTHQEVFGEIARTFREFDDTGQRDRTYSIFGGLLAQGVAPREALDQAQDFISLTDGMASSIQNLETSLYVFSAIFRREFTETVQSGARLYGELRNRLRAPLLAELAEEVRGTDALLRLEDGQAARDQRTADIFAAGSERFREQDQSETNASRAFVSNLRRQQPFSRERLAENTGDLVSVIPTDVVDAVTNNIQLRRDANAELLQLEQETAAEIQIIQENLTLSAENKAKAIERIERRSALERIRIENDVSQRQRASFQSVVSNFVSGVAQMIAAEAQLALARRATDALSSLFGGGAAAGAGLLGGVALPLVAGLGLAYGASQIIGRSTPSIDVHQRLAAGRGSDTPMLEANISVNVEASGTRLGQANERVQLKTARWGG